MTSWAEDKFVGSEELSANVGIGVDDSSPLTPARVGAEGSAAPASFSDELPSHMELRDAIAGTPYMEAE